MVAHKAVLRQLASMPSRAAKLRVPVPVSAATVRAVVAEAERLADGRAEEEPAA